MPVGHSLPIISLALLGASPAQRQSSRTTPSAIARIVGSMSARVVTDGLATAFGAAVAMDGRTIYSRSFGMADVTAGIRAGPATAIDLQGLRFTRAGRQDLS